MSGSKKSVPSSTEAPAAPAAAPYQVLARRTRPQTFSDVIGQEHVTQTLVNAIRAGRLAHAFVFSGMRGVGKTTTARILAKALNCELGPTPEPCNRCRNCIEITEGRSLDVLEVDAASQTGIDAARELLETVKYQPAAGRFRVYIIDEAHGLSKQAVDAFLKTLEEPPPHVKFILATTSAQKLPATVLSRCQRYDFRAVPPQTIAAALGEIARAEGREVEEGALLSVARESGGSLRDAMSLLDQVLAFSPSAIDGAAVSGALGLPSRQAVRDLVAAAIARDPAAALRVVGEVFSQGADLARFCGDALERLRHLTVLSVVGRAALVDLLPTELDELATAAAQASPADLQRWFKILLDTHDDLARSPRPRLVLEMAAVRLATLGPLVPIEELVARLEALEGGRGAARPAPGGPAPRVASSAPGPAVQAMGAGPATRRPATANDGVATRPASAPEPAPTRTERATDAAPSGAAIGLPDEAPEQQRWKTLCDALQREKASRFFRLSYSRVISVGPEAVRVAVAGREAANALLEPEARRSIEAAIEREFGGKLRFEPVVPSEASGEASARADQQSLDRQAREDPVVQLSVELLQGRVEAVVPRNRR